MAKNLQARTYLVLFIFKKFTFSYQITRVLLKNFTEGNMTQKLGKTILKKNCTGNLYYQLALYPLRNIDL